MSSPGPRSTPVFQCPHIRPWTVKWGIASNTKWCVKCKTLVHATIDFDGHP